MSITKVIGLLKKGTREVTKVIIESKLEEIDYELCTVQVEVNEGQDRKVLVCLHDSSSTFMQEDCSSTGDDTSSEDEMSVTTRKMEERMNLTTQFKSKWLLKLQTCRLGMGNYTCSDLTCRQDY